MSGRVTPSSAATMGPPVGRDRFAPVAASLLRGEPVDHGLGDEADALLGAPEALAVEHRILADHGSVVIEAYRDRVADFSALYEMDAGEAALIGMTVMAIGTDLPEIANSVISAATGHGDLNVGDSAGSALTQVTLVLGILCFVGRIDSERRIVAALGALTAAALALVALLVADSSFGRLDGLILVTAWVVALIGLRTLVPDATRTESDTGPIGRHVMIAGAWLGVVAIAATVVVQSFVRITESIGVPEILAGAVVLALGTSLPELIVDWTAIRRGAAALALGDLFGSSLLDATLAIGIGPAITPNEVSSVASATCLIAAAGVVATTITVVARRRLDASTGFVLLGIYLAASIGLIAVTG